MSRFNPSSFSRALEERSALSSSRRSSSIYDAVIDHGDAGMETVTRRIDCARERKEKDGKGQSSFEGVRRRAKATTTRNANAPRDRVSVVSGPRPAGAVILRHRGCGSGAAVARDARFRASRSTGGAFRDARPSWIRRSARGPTATASPRRRFDRSTRGRTCPMRKNCALRSRARTCRVETERRETHLRVIGVVARHRARVDDTERCVSTQHERRARGTGEWRSYAGRGCFTSFHLLPSQTPREYESKNSVNIYAFYRDCLLAYMRAHFRSNVKTSSSSKPRARLAKNAFARSLDSRVTRDTRDTLTTLGDHPRLRSWSRTARPTWR